MSQDDRTRRELLGLTALAAASVSIASQEAAAQELPSLLEGKSQAPPPEVKAVPMPPPSKSDEMAPPPVVFKRPHDDEVLWNKVKEAIRANFQISESNSFTSPVAVTSLRIEKGFAFSAEPEDQDFSPLHVEPLLDQAADLLDRGLRDRAVWDDLASKQIQLALELNEYWELDAIHQEEEAAGIYDTSARQSAADRNAEQQNLAWQDWNADVVKSLLTWGYSDGTLVEQWNASRKSAWLFGLVAYMMKDQQFSSYVNHTWDSVPGTMSHWSIDSIEKTAWHSLILQKGAHVSQEGVFRGLAATSRQRLPGLDAKSRWDASNAGFQRRRTIVARKYEDLKSRAATDPDGVLNYSKRMTPLQERFRYDFRNAIARMTAASVGLKAIYGIELQLPTTPAGIGYFDDCLLWTRRAIQAIVRFTRMDQSTVVPVSLRRVMGKDEWKKGCSKGVWEFSLPESVFGGFYHSRLRGISAAVSGAGQQDAVWRLHVQAPKVGATRHLSGQLIDLDQSMVPPSVLGRVTTRTAVRDPDVVGAQALHNASPIGRWVVRAVDCLPEQMHPDDLEDLQLDLNVAFRTKRGTALIEFPGLGGER